MDGEWNVRRTGGLLPPMAGLVRKHIEGDRGWTVVAGVRVPFRVDGNVLRYPFGIVDELARDGGDAYVGTTRLFGLRIGSFRMTRKPA